MNENNKTAQPGELYLASFCDDVKDNNLNYF